MTETEINDVLCTKLADTITANVEWENRQFTQPRETIWYRAQFFPGDVNTAAISLNSENRYVGAFQVTVFAPLNKGRAPAEVQVDVILAAFKRGTILTGTGINVLCTKAYRRAALEEKDVFYIPVVIEWLANLAN
jgi:hypothetical protein